jgi:hypothetical protein
VPVLGRRKRRGLLRLMVEVVVVVVKMVLLQPRDLGLRVPPSRIRTV